MKKTLWILPLLAVASACNNAPANNVAANQTSGLPVPPDRAEAPPAPPQQGEQAGMPAGLDCVRNRLSPEQRTAVAQAAMEQVSREDPRAQALLQAADSCASELSWSPEKKQIATTFSIAAAGAAGVRQELGSQNVRIEELDSAILGDAELMAAAGRGQMDAAVGRAFGQRHNEEIERIAGGPPEGRVAFRIGNYIAFRAIAEALAAKFGREP